MWNGTAATLKPRPTRIRAKPARRRPGREQGVGGQEGGDPGQRGGAGGAVDHGDAVEHHGRREGAEHEVLEAGLARLQPAPVEGGQDVQGDREDLEGQEHDDEVVGRGHQQHARRRQQQEGVVLGPLDLFPAEVALGDQEPEGGGGQDDRPGEDGEAVDGHHARQGLVGGAVGDDGPQLDGDQARGGHAGQADDQVLGRQVPPAPVQRRHHAPAPSPRAMRATSGPTASQSTLGTGMLVSSGGVWARRAARAFNRGSPRPSLGAFRPELGDLRGCR